MPEVSLYDLHEMRSFQADVQGGRAAALHAGMGDQLGDDDDDDEDELGPQPVAFKGETEGQKVSYGGALLPGEGAAIAQYVQQNMRIPRRGEIGWKADEIESLEHQGYVMSGSRHQRMNAIRLRKENQVYSAEEKRALAMISLEERAQKESAVVGEFRQMLTKRLSQAGQDVSGEPDFASN